MAENQTASEDSGQQQQQQPQQDQQQSNQQQDSSPDQESSSDSITPNPRSKTVHTRSSLTSIKVPRAMTSTSAVDGGDHQSHGSGKHHHHNNHHNHVHNNSGHHGHRVIHRTTSESLRLGSDYPGSSSMTNSTSNSSSVHGGGGGSSTLATTTTTNNSNSTSNHSHSMSSSSSHSHSSHPHSHHHQHPSNSGGGPLQRKPKTSSFQITSVTVGNKLSSDNGDDSADDLDESHTDDNSRITDLENETPSVSEDTFSKEDVFFANNALSTTAPVIPTSAQYGLVVVDPIGTSVGQTIQNVQVNVADNIINVVSAVGNKKKPEVKETQHRSERFKVVKIESTEPFRRGRWMCMDYLDHSGNQVLNKDNTPEKSAPGSVSVATSGEDTSRGTTQTAIIVTNDTNAPGGGVENHIDAAAKLTADGNLNIYRSESQTSAGTGQDTNQTVTHAQTMSGNTNLQQQQLPNQFQGQNFEGSHGQTMPIVTDFQQQSQNQVNGNESSVAGQSQPASFFANASAGNGGGGGSTPSTFQQQPSTPAHGTTLPTNIHMQNGGGVGSGNGTNIQSASYAPPPVPASGVDVGSVAPTTSIQQVTSQQQQQQSPRVYVSQSGTSVTPQSYPSAANIISGATYTSAPATNQLVTETVQPTQQQSDSNTATSASGGGSGQSQQQPQFQTMHSNSLAGQTMPILNQITYDGQSQQQQQPSQAATNTPATISDPTTIAATIQQQQIDNNNFTTNTSNTTNNPAASSSSTTAESSTTITSSSGAVVGGGVGTGISNTISQQAPAPSSSLSVAGSVQGSTSGGSTATSTTGSTDDHQLHQNPETETESASGTSAVAIDNKIEQAMDLVKSHLMIAVREEVEVLKEKISELMDKINQLEVENTILKANMSTETLHQLQLQAQLQIAGSGTGSLIAAQPPQSQQSQQQPPTTQSSQPPSSQQQNQPQQQQVTAQANPANTTNGPIS